MKILHISPGLQETCGVSNFIVESSRALQALGHDICIVTTMTCGYPAEDLDIQLLADPRQVDFSPDIVHIHTLWSPYVHKAARWCRRNRLPYVVSPHGSLTPWALRHKWWKKAPALLLYQYYDLLRADAFHVTACSEEKDLRRLRLQQPIITAPLGAAAFSNAESAPVRPDSYKNLLFISRIHPKKGLDLLVNAWAALSDAVKEGWRLLIAGPNDIGYQEELLELAAKAGLNVEDWRDRLSFGKKNMTGGSEVSVAEFSRHLAGSQAELIFTGPVYHQAKDFFYSIADLFVLPSYSENFGVVVVDALAHGVPVITTKGTPWQELLGNDATLRAGGRCGWWIDIGAEPLADALAEAMSLTDENRKALGENGRRLVAEKYTWAAVGKKMAQGYQEVLDKR